MQLIKIKIISILFFAGCFSFSKPLAAQNIDIDLLESINPQQPNSFIWKSVSNSGYPLSLATPIGIWAYGESKHDNHIKFQAYTIGSGILVASAGTLFLKKIFNRPRPSATYSTIHPYHIEYGESFPSGHVTAAFATATGVALQYKKWYIVVPAYAWATGVGYSRMYLGEHYPSDVLGGAAMGTGSAILSYWLSKKIFRHAHTHTSGTAQ